MSESPTETAIRFLRQCAEACRSQSFLEFAHEWLESRGEQLDGARIFEQGSEAVRLLHELGAYVIEHEA